MFFFFLKYFIPCIVFYLENQQENMELITNEADPFESKQIEIENENMEGVTTKANPFQNKQMQTNFQRLTPEERKLFICLPYFK